MDWLGASPRRLGTVLLVFGLVGVVLAGILALGLIGGAVSARNLDDRIATDQARLAATLERLTTTVDQLASTTDHAGATLRTTSAMVGAAGDALDELAAATDALADGLDFSVFGQQPLAGAAGRFANLGEQIRVFADGTDALAANLDTNAIDVAELADRIRAVGKDVEELAARVGAFDRTGDIVGLLVGGILLGGLVDAWLAVGAALIAWLGWRLRRVRA
jgi:outer membrane murein-binding lipoprotein Lpp